MVELFLQLPDLVAVKVEPQRIRAILRNPCEGLRHFLDSTYDPDFIDRQVEVHEL